MVIGAGHEAPECVVYSSSPLLLYFWVQRGEDLYLNFSALSFCVVKVLRLGNPPHKEANQEPFRSAMSEIYHPSEEPDDAVLKVDAFSTEP